MGKTLTQLASERGFLPENASTRDLDPFKLPQILTEYGIWAISQMSDKEMIDDLVASGKMGAAARLSLFVTRETENIMHAEARLCESCDKCRWKAEKCGICSRGGKHDLWEPCGGDE